MRVTFDRVSISLGGAPVIQDASLTIEPGHTVGILGANGSGKSTLLRSLYRVVKPTSGTVLLDGADVWTMPLRKVARNVAVMAQESESEFDLDVLDVVLLGRVPHRKGFGADTQKDLHLAEQALTDVGSLDFASRAFSGLSGGEKQRVLLARALVQQSRVLVLDEPTNHLDIAFQLELMHIISNLGLTTIAALHDLNLAIAHCDEVAVMQSGRLAAFGRPEDVLTPELIGDVFGVHSHRLRHPESGQLLIAYSSRQSRQTTSLQEKVQQ
ncbi:ABC transporter ATP-binding protein [Cryobacterium sp. PH31-O1]|uniref:ABC transporter ATP-binding protein n=1 Tax=Cryobacterium sp. PH31-O1 TaxID=3046306 RepID=UPI0024BB91E2|nr:ABC transporter ATP-binding protein [Cryobacterium sp. PH31-O1]MDJ0338732.1 ABC transporter ATP-binding protein [Cryobacterium sp. PH31-O1]